MAILVTGGAGYIGSHTCVQLLEAGYEVIVLDNFSNSKPGVLKRIKEITGKNFISVAGDILDRKLLDSIFSEFHIDSVVHFAGLKSVPESVGIPLNYYRNNVSGSINLFEAMKENDVKNIVFSSSATVYGTTDKTPITEDEPLSAFNPYGRTKLMIEDILHDLHRSDNNWNIFLLRYFNPVGAHHSGLIGEDPNGIPNNLVPYISQVAAGKLKQLGICGTDYPTRDGTGVRDYIHVVDLADGHLKALEKLAGNPGIAAYNLGTGRGTTVLEMVGAFEKVLGRKIPCIIKDRRPGDVAECWSDPSKAGRELGWKAVRDINDMCRDTWNWQVKNPEGYAD